MAARRRPRWSAAALVAVGVWVVVALLSVTTAWRTLEMKGLDWLGTLRPPGAADSPIVIVGIDEPSFAELGMQWPWPRDVHARLIERLREAGAAVVAFDIVFAEPSSPAADERLAAAIRTAGNVVLAADETLIENRHVVQRLRIEPLPEFLEAGARAGTITVTIDGDSVIRRLTGRPAAFWRVVLERYREGTAAPGPAPDVPPGALIRYAGPDHTFPFVSYYQALDPATFLPPGFFSGKIVLVGLDVKPSPDPVASQADMFVTPFMGSTQRLMPGVEVQANMMHSVMTGRAVRELPRMAEIAVLAALGLVSAWRMRRWEPGSSALAAFGLGAAVVVAAVALFEYGGVWLPALGLLTGLAILYVAEGALAFLRERTLRRRIRRAFGQYVSPQVVKEMLRHPERLVLGGERRKLTILFGDLAGFTAMSEQLSPEQVAVILNRCLTEVTRIVVRHGGTVDKFMGDCIMAFWGAPLNDPDHALHACQAAEEMQAAVARLCEEFVREGRPPIHMRIGVNSGTAIVGNMGSETLFDYTAIGDDVNLASRLEGVNKVYDTDVLLAETTAAAVEGRVPLRRVDRVRVKGRQQPVEIFTPLRHPAIGKPNEEGIQAYREQRWDDAEASWREVLKLAPEDPVATAFLARIAGYRREPPPADWDGSFTLESK
ncbi:MAG: CHASE2 domain-containing protein [Candidatus Rokuibacteriota bacterium]